MAVTSSYYLPGGESDKADCSETSGCLGACYELSKGLATAVYNCLECVDLGLTQAIREHDVVAFLQGGAELSLPSHSRLRAPVGIRA